MKKINLSPKDLTLAAIFSAITIILGLTPLGLIPLGFMNVTTLHIPTICAGIIGGPIIGGAVGLMFGLFSVFRNMTTPTALSFVFLNPLVSVLPRILLGVLAALLYRHLPFQNKNLRLGVTTALSTLFHSFTVLFLAFIFYRNMIYQMIRVKASVALGTIFITNSPMEIISSVIIVIIVGRALLRANN